MGLEQIIQTLVIIGVMLYIGYFIWMQLDIPKIVKALLDTKVAIQKTIEDHKKPR